MEPVNSLRTLDSLLLSYNVKRISLKKALWLFALASIQSQSPLFGRDIK